MSVRSGHGDHPERVADPRGSRPVRPGVNPDHRPLVQERRASTETSRPARPYQPARTQPNDRRAVRGGPRTTNYGNWAALTGGVTAQNETPRGNGGLHNDIHEKGTNVRGDCQPCAALAHAIRITTRNALIYRLTGALDDTTGHTADAFYNLDTAGPHTCGRWT
jgi:hypothetical protein